MKKRVIVEQQGRNIMEFVVNSKGRTNDDIYESVAMALWNKIHKNNQWVPVPNGEFERTFSIWMMSGKTKLRQDVLAQSIMIIEWYNVTIKINDEWEQQG